MSEAATPATMALSGAPALEYPFQAPRPDGSVVEVAPGVTREEVQAKTGVPLH